MKPITSSFLIIMIVLVFSFALFANNLEVENITLTGQNTTDDYTMIQFDISWDNSWRDMINWDAAWIFARYKVSNGEWKGAYLSTTDGDHTAPAGAVINNGNNGGIYAPGVFIYRDANGAGSNDWDNVQLRWNYGDNVPPVDDGDMVTVKVFAIEMVYVPQSAYSLGDDGSSGSTTNHFYMNGYSWAVTIPVQTSLVMGPTEGLLWADGEIEVGTSNANFPTGYNAFYCMKYELTQEQYVDFLNTLTRTQQNTRTYVDISNTSVSGVVYVMDGNTTMNNNQCIRLDEPLPASGPVTFYCDRDGDGIRNEDNDGQNIACNWLTWMDNCAYADWAGLRPMTELEFEKACRGDQPAISGEYAWGNGNIHSTAYSISNEGYYNSIITTQPTGTGNAIWNNTFGRPLRAGIFAQSSTSRQEAGATYYGIMEMSGNLWERVVTIGNADGRAFTGNHGDGQLYVDGNAWGVPSWPGYIGVTVTGNTGHGLRGGSCETGNEYARTSNRTYGATVYVQSSGHGFRCVRTAP